MINKPFIKLFKAAGGFYVYDVNTNHLLKVDQLLYNALLSILKNGMKNVEPLPETIQNDLFSLQSEGYLKDNPIKQIISPYSCVFKGYLHGKMNSLILEVTQKCNFRCKYCDYSSDEFFNRNHSTKDMSIEVAKKAIDMYFENSIYENSKSFGFYGGEPLMVFPLVKKCVEYIKSKCDSNEVFYRMTTNGALLSEEMIKFFSENKFKITISLDGPKDYHNKNRRFFADDSGTFDTVYKKLKMIYEMKDSYPLHITLNTVWDGGISRTEIENYFRNDPIIKNYSFNINNMVSSDLNTYFTVEEKDVLIDKRNDLENILVKKFNNEDILELTNNKYNYLLNRLKDHYDLPETYHHSGMCIAGRQNLYVTTDGNLFPCEKFPLNCSYSKIGTVWEGFYYNKIHQLLNFGEITKEECKKCWAIRLCSMCALVANGKDVLSKSAKLAYCTQQKQQLIADLKSIVSLINIENNFSI